MANGKEKLDGKDRQILNRVTSGMSFDIRVLSERIKQEIQRLRRSGLDEQQIIGVLSRDFESKGRIFGEFQNAVKRGLIGGINQAFRRTGKMGQSLKWISVSKNVCPDYKERAGEVDTYENWVAKGLPASGWSLCKEYCYCQLMPESLDIDENITI